MVTMIMERFQARHLQQIDLQPAQLPTWKAYGSPAYASALENTLAYTGRIRGRIIVCGGIIDVATDTGHMWCFLSRDARHHMVRLHRTAQRFLKVAGKQRLCATSEVGFDDGCRWLDLLGFERTDLLRAYGPDGSDHYLYEKVH